MEKRKKKKSLKPYSQYPRGKNLPTVPHQNSQARYKYAVQLTPYRGNSWRFSRRFSRRQKKGDTKKKVYFCRKLFASILSRMKLWSFANEWVWWKDGKYTLICRPKRVSLESMLTLWRTWRVIKLLNLFSPKAIWSQISASKCRKKANSACVIIAIYCSIWNNTRDITL